MPGKDIFLSYASEDRSRIALLVNALENTGWSVFWDREIPVGKTWPEVLEDEITTSRSVVVVWSEKSGKSSWVLEEANEGKRRGVLFPVRIDAVEPPFGYRGVQAADLVGWDGSPSALAFRGLLKHLGARLGKPQAEREVEESLRQAETRQAKEAEERRRVDTEAAARKAEEERSLEAERASRRGTKVEPLRAPLARPRPSRMELADLLGVRGPSISWKHTLVFLLAICAGNVSLQHPKIWLVNSSYSVFSVGAAVVAFRYIKNPLIACVAAVLLAAPGKEALGLFLGAKIDHPMVHMGLIALSGLFFWGGAVLGLRSPGPWWLGLTIGLIAGGIASGLSWRQWFALTDPARTIASSPLDWAIPSTVSALVTIVALWLLRRVVRAA